jgi:hypothetical protein
MLNNSLFIACKMTTMNLFLDFTLLVYEGESVNRSQMEVRKTTVMDIVGFLCVTLGSSTIQLH